MSSLAERAAEECPLLEDDEDEAQKCSNDKAPNAENWMSIGCGTVAVGQHETVGGRKSNNWQSQLRAHAHSKQSNYVKWSCKLLRRKQLLGVLAAALLLLYVNSTLMKDDTDERIPVQHYSHVPGMREANEAAPIAGDIDINYHTLPAEQIQQYLQEDELLHKDVQFVAANIDMPNISFNSIEYYTDAPTFINSSADANAFVPRAVVGDIAPELPQNYNATAIASAVTLKPINFNNNSTLPNYAPTFELTVPSIEINPPTGYLVWSENCKMPNIDPYLPEIMKYFKREKYKPCSFIKALTRVEFRKDIQRYVLVINKDAISWYSRSGIVDCCYQSIERKYTGINADRNVSLTECISFKSETQLASTIDNILVKCHAKKKQVYINGHAMMPAREDLRKRFSTWRENDKNKNFDRPPSVLMIGIDSISRINLIRAMPNTAQYLYDNEWFEMSGYNKIDDNTFPNLMAVLTGRNKTNALNKCSPTKLHGLDNCNFVWNTFRDHGYVTAYAEDEALINTFNYLKVGFDKAPVDFYLRPFLLSAEKHLNIKRKSNLINCLGFNHSAEIVYDYAVELAQRFKDEPYFGLFWTNTFSHNAISDCTSMDAKMVEYLKRFAALGTLENTIVVFFSDHGMRFGPTRKTLSGHLEERLPFMFLWLPQRLKQEHPEFVNALSVNKNRLTNPYDLHMTLKHVLKLSGRVEDQQQLAVAEDCPRCQTLLMPVPHNRSCEEVAIADHWCTCIPYQVVYKNAKPVRKLATAMVSYINDYVATFRNGTFNSICVPLQLADVDNAYRAQHQINANASEVETYRLIFRTKPNKAMFEATVRYNVITGDTEVTGEISRLNSYSADSDCMEDGGAKKYCSCRKKKVL